MNKVKPHLWLIQFVGLIVPRRLRGDWRGEWEAELRYREAMLEDWGRLDRRKKLDLLWRSLGAFRDALWMQTNRWEDELIQDLRFGARMLIKQRGFTLMAMLSLSLGIGAGTLVFSLIQALFFGAAPGVVAPDQLVGVCMLDVVTRKPYPLAIRYPDFQYFRQTNRVFSGLASHSADRLADGESAAEIQAEIVSENYFEVLGVRPWLGRLFLPEESSSPGRVPVVVLSHSFWQRRFNGDEQCIGRTIRLNGVTSTVVGVASPGFHGAFVGLAADVWLPNATAQMVSGNFNLQSRDSAVFDLIGRLKSGVTAEQAQAEMTVSASQMEASYPNTNKNAGVLLYPLRGVHPHLRSAKAELPSVLAAAVGCILLIACINLAGLLLARGAARGKEIAIRLALGSSRGRLIRQLLTESLLVSLMGGAGGWLLAYWGAHLLGSYYFPEIDGVRPFYVFRFDGMVFLFSLLLAVCTGLIFGLVPAVQASRTALVPALKDDSLTFGYRRPKLRAAFLVTQVAFSVVLLVGAGLLIRSFAKLESGTGFDADGVVLVRMKPRLSGYNRQQARVYYRDVQRRLESLAVVQSVTFSGSLPLQDWGTDARVMLPGEQPVNGEAGRRVKENKVAPGFFETLRIPLLRGRTFADPDIDEARKGRHAVIVNEALALQLWPNQEAVGQTVLVEEQPCEVVGVVRYDSVHRSGDVPQPFLFRAEFGGSRMLVRLHGDPAALLPMVRREVLAVDPHVAISEALPLHEMVRNYFSSVTIALAVLGYTGALALLLSAVGLYGSLALALTQRTREIGIRMALGARRADVSRLILREGLGVAGFGVSLGLVAALAATRFLSGFMYGVARHDPPTFAGVALVLTGVTLLACWVPARRATRTDPIAALRCQ
jgi:predicted permease